MRQVTFGGDSAETYWNFHNKQLIFNPILKIGVLDVIKCF